MWHCMASQVSYNSWTDASKQISSYFRWTFQLSRKPSMLSNNSSSDKYHEHFFYLERTLLLKGYSQSNCRQAVQDYSIWCSSIVQFSHMEVVVYVKIRNYKNLTSFRCLLEQPQFEEIKFKSDKIDVLNAAEPKVKCFHHKTTPCFTLSKAVHASAISHSFRLWF